MQKMQLEILGDDPRFKDVVNIKVPSTYTHRTASLPDRMAKLVRPAAIALQNSTQT
jgi:hypothetical protein